MKNLKSKLPVILFLALFLVLLIVPMISFAAPGDDTTSGTIPNDRVSGTIPSKGEGVIHNPLGTTTDIPALIQKILKDAVKIGLPVLALALIYCGFLFVAARGDSKKLETAKEALLYTIVGGALLLGAWAIANVIVTVVQSL